MRNVSLALFALAATAACVGPYYAPPPQGSYSSPNITINNSANSSGYAASSAPTRPLATLREEPTQVAPPPVRSSSSGSDSGGKDPRSVLILQGTRLDRSTEVLGVVDVHEQMANEAAALQRLRERAAALGADAVVGVEFHHGEEANEPTHLSGLAVRFVTLPRDLR